MTLPDLDLSVYLVTDRAMAVARGGDVAGTVEAAVAGGVTAVQIREKDTPSAQFLDTVCAVAELLPEHVALFVNDRIDVFLAARAAGVRVTGVHVGQGDVRVTVVRELVGDDAVIGLSAATAAEVAAAATDPGRVDYLGIGVLRATHTKADAPPPLGLSGFAELVALSDLPAVAIGGITPADMHALRRSGAAGAAIVSGICAALHPELAAREYTDAWGSI